MLKTVTLSRSITTSGELGPRTTTRRLLTSLIQVLPSLRTIPSTMRYDFDLISAANNHQHLTSVDITTKDDYLLEYPICPEPFFMRKVHLDKLSIYHDWNETMIPKLKAYLALGMQIDTLHVRATPTNITRLLSLGTFGVRELRLDFLVSSSVEVFEGRFPEIVQSLVGLKRIIFVAFSNSRLNQQLPLLPDLGVDGSVEESSRPWVSGYGIERVRAHNTDQQGSFRWEDDWEVTTMTIVNCSRPVSLHDVLRNVSLHAPRLRWLKLTSGSRQTSKEEMVAVSSPPIYSLPTHYLRVSLGRNHIRR